MRSALTAAAGAAVFLGAGGAAVSSGCRPEVTCEDTLSCGVPPAGDAAAETVATGDAHPDGPGDAAQPETDAGDGPIADAGDGAEAGCEVGTKTCFGKCVPLDDPKTGCAGPGCWPCFPNASATCAGGACTFGACDAGFADCDADKADGCEVQLETNAQHCGKCGRDCLGGPCSAGACQPFALVAPDEGKLPGALALDGTNVFWTDSSLGTVKKVAKAGGPVTVLASAQAKPLWIAVDSSGVYWVNTDGTLMKCAKDGSGQVLLAKFQPPTGTIALDDTSVYSYLWSDILKVPKAGGSPVVFATVALAEVRSVAAAVPYLYAATSSGVLRFALAGGAPTVLATDADQPRAICVGSNDVLWTSKGSSDTEGRVSRVPIAGGAVGVLATGQHAPWSIATEGPFAYWVNAGTVANGFKDGQLARAAVNGGPVTVLTPLQTDLTNGLAVDDKAIYFVHTQFGAVGKLAK